MQLVGSDAEIELAIADGGDRWIEEVAAHPRPWTSDAPQPSDEICCALNCWSKVSEVKIHLLLRAWPFVRARGNVLEAPRRWEFQREQPSPSVGLPMSSETACASLVARARGKRIPTLGRVRDRHQEVRVGKGGTDRWSKVF